MTDQEREDLRIKLHGSPGRHRRPGSGPRSRRGPDDPVQRARLEDPPAAHLVGQGWRRQVERHHQPRGRAGPGRLLGRRRRRRHLRLLDPADARHRPPAHRDRPDAAAARAVGRALHLDRLLRARGRGRHLAWPDAAQGARAVPHRRVLGRARLPPHRHAARHRRHRPQPQPVPAARRGVRRHHAAAGGAEGRRAVGGDGRQGQPAGEGHHREHVVVHRRRRQALRAVRLGRRPAARRRARRAAARPAPAGDRRCARAATTAARSPPSTPTARSPRRSGRSPRRSPSTSSRRRSSAPSSRSSDPAFGRVRSRIVSDHIAVAWERCVGMRCGRGGVGVRARRRVFRRRRHAGDRPVRGVRARLRR